MNKLGSVQCACILTMSSSLPSQKECSRKAWAGISVCGDGGGGFFVLNKEVG